jgi:hypothetical protein
VSLVADDRTATKVGAVALLVAVAGVIFVAAILPPLAGRGALRVRVYYLELAGMKEGAPVRSAGEIIGRVETIGFVPAGAQSPLGGQAGAAVYLALDPERIARAWRGGVWVISSRGPLSARYVEVIPPPVAAGEEAARPVVAGMQLRGVDPPSLDRVLQRTWTNLMIARRFFDEVGPEARRLRGELRALAQTLRDLRAGTGTGSGSGSGSGSETESGSESESGSGSGSGSESESESASGSESESASGTASASSFALGDDRLAQLSLELDQLLDEADRAWNDTLGGPTGLARLQALARHGAATWRTALLAGGELTSLFDRLRGELGRVQAQLEAAAPSVKLAALIAQVSALGGKLAAIEQSARVIAQRWQRREGTLGRLLSDPEFPEDAKELGKILKRQPWRIFGHPDDE